MRLLIATDHAFFRYQEAVFDTYCFDEAFFADYCRVFEEVIVISRMSHVEQLPKGAFHSDGSGVDFIDVPNVRRLKWFLAAGVISRPMIGSAIEHCDALIARVPSELGWISCNLAGARGKPFMVEVIGDPKETWLSSGRGLPYRFIAWIESLRLKKICRMAGVASYVNRSYLPREYPVSDKATFDCISSIRLSDESLLSPRMYQPRSGPLELLQVGRLEPRKRCADSIKACSIAIGRGVPVRLHFAGEGPDLGMLEGLVSDLKLQSDIIFHGHISARGELNRLIDSCDVFIMPTASEGLPRSMLEAMARGLPAIGSLTPGVDELLRKSDSFEVGDVQAIASLIEALARAPERLSEMSAYSISVASNYLNSALSPKRRFLYTLLREQAKKN
jgi:phosphatidylinositol alpha-1,6-mannosyltransferase